MKKYDAWLFDMDGTVLDTLEDLKNSVNYMLKSKGMAERNSEEIRRFLGYGFVNLLKSSLEYEISEEEFEECKKTYQEYYAVHCTDETKPYDGIIDVLTKLKENGVKIALVSNKHESAVMSLNERYFGGMFDEVSGDREGVNRKPAPDSVYIVLEKLGISKEKALFIGDSEVDSKTAQNAGVDFVGVTWGFRDKEQLIKSGASDFADKPSDLLEFLQ